MIQRYLMGPKGGYEDADKKCRQHNCQGVPYLGGNAEGSFNYCNYELFYLFKSFPKGHLRVWIHCPP